MKNLQSLCDELEMIPDFKKTEKGHYLLPLTDTLQIEVRSLNPGAYFTSPIAPCPKPKREELLIQLMKANLFGQGTLGAAIAYQEDENLLTLSSALPYDMDYRTFKEGLEDFANIVEYWREEVALHVKRAQEEIL